MSLRTGKFSGRTLHLYEESILKKVVSIVLLLLAVLVTSVQASNGRVLNSLQNFLQRETTYLAFKTTATFANVSKTSLMSFMGDPINDIHWYPGIYNESQTVGSGPGVGATYAEDITDGTNFWTNVVRLDEFVTPTYWLPGYEVQVTIGPAKTWSLVTFSDPGRTGNAVWTSYSIIEENEFVTFEQLQGLLGFAYQQAAGYLGTTLLSTSTDEIGTFTTDSEGHVIWPFSISMP